MLFEIKDLYVILWQIKLSQRMLQDQSYHNSQEKGVGQMLDVQASNLLK